MWQTGIIGFQTWSTFQKMMVTQNFQKLVFTLVKKFYLLRQISTNVKFISMPAHPAKFAKTLAKDSTASRRCVRKGST